MSALDFMMGCIGTGVFLVCAAWSFKILSDTRTRSRSARELVQRKDEPMDPMGKRLQEFRDARFGRPMMAPEPTEPRAPPTWPVMQTRTIPRKPTPPPDDKKTKDEGKKQGGK